uniref:ATP-dependent RNA helicase DHX33 n=1 Tax=Rhabditophanes sp. KR3021 TaxID=114890 RepID=A0AC35TWK0_9BILA
MKTTSFKPTQNGTKRKSVEFFEENVPVAKNAQLLKPVHQISLPIHAVKGELKSLFQSNGVTVLIGETGCGKSTQVPKFCLEAGLGENGLIGITQPRRVAAISLAQRVSAEMGTECGGLIGYRVRFENCTSHSTKIVYLTDGILLREAMHDNCFKKYSCIIVDEAHERSVHTDILLSLLKICKQQRDQVGNHLKLTIIVMSATLQADLFQAYFESSSLYHVKGRSFPIGLYHAEELKKEDDNYFFNTVQTIFKLHAEEALDMHVLAFLTGQDEIEAGCRQCREKNVHLEHPIVALPLYASLSHADQLKVFENVGPGVRKVIFCTNIAETSLTIPGIRIVIDCGKIKQKSYNSGTKADILKVGNISKAQSNQRAGRAGRDAPGKAYRLYSQKSYNDFRDTTEAEILRINLSSVLLDLFSLGMKNPRKLKLIEMPQEESFEAAIEELMMLKAITTMSKSCYGLTHLGSKLSFFPVDPKLGRILVAASELDCLEEALSIVACMSVENLFIAPPENERDQAEVSKKKFETNEGDHVMQLRVYRMFVDIKKNKTNSEVDKWCRDHFISKRNLLTAVSIRKQLREICVGRKFEIKSCGANTNVLRQALSLGLFINAAKFNKSLDKFVLLINPSVQLKIHPSSCLHRTKPSTIIFSELCKTSDLFAKDCSIIDIDWIANVIKV